MRALDKISSHQRCNVGRKVTEGSEEAQAVDRFLKPLGEAEGRDDEDTAEQGENRADTFNHVKGVVNARVLSGPVGVVVARHGGGWCATAQGISEDSERVVKKLSIISALQE